MESRTSLAFMLLCEPVPVCQMTSVSAPAASPQPPLWTPVRWPQPSLAIQSPRLHGSPACQLLREDKTSQGDSKGVKSTLPSAHFHCSSVPLRRV